MVIIKTQYRIEQEKQKRINYEIELKQQTVEREMEFRLRDSE
jgi:hypothetical protein